MGRQIGRPDYRLNAVMKITFRNGRDITAVKLL